MSKRLRSTPRARVRQRESLRGGAPGQQASSSRRVSGAGFPPAGFAGWRAAAGGAGGCRAEARSRCPRRLARRRRIGACRVAADAGEGAAARRAPGRAALSISMTMSANAASGRCTLRLWFRINTPAGSLPPGATPRAPSAVSACCDRRAAESARPCRSPGDRTESPGTRGRRGRR